MMSVALLCLGLTCCFGALQTGASAATLQFRECTNEQQAQLRTDMEQVAARLGAALAAVQAVRPHGAWNDAAPKFEDYQKWFDASDEEYPFVLQTFTRMNEVAQGPAVLVLECSRTQKAAWAETFPLADPKYIALYPQFFTKAPPGLPSAPLELYSTKDYQDAQPQILIHELSHYVDHEQIVHYIDENEIRTRVCGSSAELHAHNAARNAFNYEFFVLEAIVNKRCYP